MDSSQFLNPPNSSSSTAGNRGRDGNPALQTAQLYRGRYRRRIYDCNVAGADELISCQRIRMGLAHNVEAPIIIERIITARPTGLPAPNLVDLSIKSSPKESLRKVQKDTEIIVIVKLTVVKKNYGVFLFRYRNGLNFRAGLKEDAQKPALKTWTEVYLPDKDWPTPPNRELSGTKAYRPISIARFVPPVGILWENITHYNPFDYKSKIH